MEKVLKLSCILLLEETQHLVNIRIYIVITSVELIGGSIMNMFMNGNVGIGNKIGVGKLHRRNDTAIQQQVTT